MVFSDKKIAPKVKDVQLASGNIHHNKLNLRDRSTEPANLFGDSNIRPKSQIRGQQPDINLNDIRMANE